MEAAEISAELETGLGGAVDVPDMPTCPLCRAKNMECWLQKPKYDRETSEPYLECGMKCQSLGLLLRGVNDNYKSQHMLWMTWRSWEPWFRNAKPFKELLREQRTAEERLNVCFRAKNEPTIQERLTAARIRCSRSKGYLSAK